MLDYVSVNDVEKFSRLTSSQFFQNAHLVSAGWAFYSNSLKVIIGRIEDDGLFRGFAVYRYRGWMGLFRRDDALKVIDNGDALISTGRPLDLEGIEVIYYPYPFKGKEPPNQFIGYWGHNYYIEATDPEDWLAYPYFKEVPQEENSSYEMKAMSELLEGLASGKILESNFFDKLSGKYHSEPKYEIEEQPFHVQLSQLGISKASLAGLERELESRKLIAPVENASKTIDSVIQRLYTSSPTAKSDALWNKLRSDVEAEDNEKKYDLDLIILEMGERELVWQNLKGGTTSMARQTFKNRLTDLRKKNTKKI